MSIEDKNFEKAVESFRMQISGRLEERVLMKRYTTFRIGGLCELMVFPKEVSELISVIDYCEKNGLPWRVIGRGSNLLVIDEGLNEVVINVQEGLNRFEQKDEGLVWAEAGIKLNRLVKLCSDLGLAGLEFSAGIPGTLGGALRMNAGAEGKEISGVVNWVEFYRYPEGRFIRKSSELRFGYRELHLNPKEVILSAELRLVKDKPENIRERIKRNLKHRRETQPVAYPSAGSVFKNPQGGYAGKLIEELGLKGLRVGDAQISELHGNFIVNRGRAKAKEVLELIKIIQERVRREKGINLELEIELWGNRQ